MNPFLIKLGKAYHTIKREGVFRGVKRVSRSLFLLVSEMLKIAKPGDILFISGGIGDSTLYRSNHVAEELRIHGFKCSTVVQDNLFLSGCAEKFKIFIFHRTLFAPKTEKFLNDLKAKNKEVIFETDDLVYDPEYLKHMDYWKQMNGFEKKLYENGVGGEILADPYVEVCTTTTTFLAKKLEERGKKVFIVPNKLSDKDLEVAERVMKHKTYNIKHDACNNEHKTCNIAQEKKCSMFHACLPVGKVPYSMIRIGYFSGTISHNKDFATIADALMQVMEKYPQVRLVLAGPLDIESKLNKFKERIEQVPFAPREKHFANIASVDINVVPLELGNPFCESKSELKFFEAGIVGIPTVAVANQTFTQAISDGVDGFLAGTTQEWVEKLSKLIESKELRESMGAMAREKALANYTNKNSSNDDYYNFLRESIK